MNAIYLLLLALLLLLLLLLALLRKHGTNQVRLLLLRQVGQRPDALLLGLRLIWWNPLGLILLCGVLTARRIRTSNEEAKTDESKGNHKTESHPLELFS